METKIEGFDSHDWISAFATRLFSVLRYESVIHEFDPYFNYRTTKYLAEEGFYNFHNWFDDRAWYPLGRIIGGKCSLLIILSEDLQHLHFFFYADIPNPFLFLQRYYLPRIDGHLCCFIPINVAPEYYNWYKECVCVPGPLIL